jgi:hypothetical protein
MRSLPYRPTRPADADASAQARPRRWWLIGLTGLLALTQAGAALRVFSLPPDLAGQISLPLPLEFVAGALWALLFAAITVNLLHRRTAHRVVPVLSGFILYSLARLLLFTQADYDRTRLPFLAALSLVLLVVLAAARLRR